VNISNKFHDYEAGGGMVFHLMSGVLDRLQQTVAVLRFSEVQRSSNGFG
jgi:hypothetical protein